MQIPTNKDNTIASLARKRTVQNKMGNWEHGELIEDKKEEGRDGAASV